MHATGERQRDSPYRLEDTMVERGSIKHGFAKDEELQREVEDELRRVGAARAQSWRDPELPRRKRSRSWVWTVRPAPSCDARTR